MKKLCEQHEMADIDQQSCVFSDKSTSVITGLNSKGDSCFLIMMFSFRWSSGYGEAEIIKAKLWSWTWQGSDNYSPILSLQIYHEF